MQGCRPPFLKVFLHTKLENGACALIFNAATWAAVEKSTQAQGKTMQQLISTAVAASLGTLMMDNYSLNR